MNSNAFSEVSENNLLSGCLYLFRILLRLCGPFSSIGDAWYTYLKRRVHCDRLSSEDHANIFGLFAGKFKLYFSLLGICVQACMFSPGCWMIEFEKSLRKLPGFKLLKLRLGRFSLSTDPLQVAIPTATTDPRCFLCNISFSLFPRVMSIYSMSTNAHYCLLISIETELTGDRPREWYSKVCLQSLCFESISTFPVYSKPLKSTSGERLVTQNLSSRGLSIDLFGTQFTVSALLGRNPSSRARNFR